MNFHIPNDCVVVVWPNVEAVLPNKLVVGWDDWPNKEVFVDPNPGEVKLVDGLPKVDVWPKPEVFLDPKLLPPKIKQILFLHLSILQLTIFMNWSYK